MRRLPQKQDNTYVHRERDRRAFALLMALAACGLMLAGGFVHAARQHFVAVRYGYQNEELRREKKKLLEEQSRLLLAREQASNPTQLETSARSIGLQPLAPTQIGLNEKETSSATPPARLIPALAVSSARLTAR